MKNILFVANQSGHGGAEKMLTWLANSLSNDNNYKIYYCILDNEASFYKLNEKITFIKSPKKSNKNFIYRNTIGFIYNNILLCKIIKRNNINLIINFNDHAVYNVWLCKICFKIKVLISQRVDPSSIISITGKLRLRLLCNADKLVFQTVSAMDFFSEKIKKKSIVINNPIFNKPNDLWEIKNTKKRILNIARIDVRQKRQDILIKAFAEVHKKYPDYNLYLFGEKIDTDYEKLIMLINELGLNECIKYCGITTDIYTEMCKSKMFVLSSDYEGIPNVLLEAMSLGMPIISTDCKPDGAKMLLNNNCGIIVPRGDSTTLAENIIKLIEHPQYAIQLGNNALKSIHRFDENIILNEWKKIILEIN